MASSPHSLACLKAVIDYALLSASNSLVPELQEGGKEDLAAKLNSFRHEATVLDYIGTLDYLWLRFNVLIAAIRLAICRFRELKACLLPEQNVGTIKEAIERWDCSSPSERPEARFKSEQPQRDEQRIGIINAIVESVVAFRMQRSEQSQLLVFVSNFAQSFAITKWDCDADDYLPEVAS